MNVYVVERRWFEKGILVGITEEIFKDRTKAVKYAKKHDTDEMPYIVKKFKVID